MYVPAEGEVPEIDKLNRKQIFKMVSCTAKQCFFLSQTVASPIYPGTEFGSLNKVEKNDEGVTIKTRCLKLVVDRLGQITNIIGL